ncbi:MAG: hypothetical protein KVP17_002061 [Porospora cf. gigantea B]|uniref:uncharacterized protein n=1 Tax=Porospora cf. gigantea B TaxID=2853592 RepID=UPI0035717A8C|nr:MAG: hypothetical protein KVP17_002061 [Porospora cf. gigantea B]
MPTRNPRRGRRPVARKDSAGWVERLTPILESYDFSRQDIVHLVSDLDYDEDRINNHIAHILETRGNHQQGQWQTVERPKKEKIEKPLPKRGTRGGRRGDRARVPVQSHADLSWPKDVPIVKAKESPGIVPIAAPVVNRDVAMTEETDHPLTWAERIKLSIQKPIETQKPFEVPEVNDTSDNNEAEVFSTPPISPTAIPQQSPVCTARPMQASPALQPRLESPVFKGILPPGIDPAALRQFHFGRTKNPLTAAPSVHDSSVVSENSILPNSQTAPDLPALGFGHKKPTEHEGIIPTQAMHATPSFPDKHQSSEPPHLPRSVYYKPDEGRSHVQDFGYDAYSAYQPYTYFGQHAPYAPAQQMPQPVPQPLPAAAQALHQQNAPWMFSNYSFPMQFAQERAGFHHFDPRQPAGFDIRDSHSWFDNQTDLAHPSFGYDYPRRGTRFPDRRPPEYRATKWQS